MEGVPWQSSGWNSVLFTAVASDSILGQGTKIKMYGAAKKKKSRWKLNLTLFSFYGPFKEKVVCMYNPTFWTLGCFLQLSFHNLSMWIYICLVSFRNVTTNARLWQCVFFLHYFQHFLFLPYLNIFRSLDSFLSSSLQCTCFLSFSRDSLFLGKTSLFF